MFPPPASPSTRRAPARLVLAAVVLALVLMAGCTGRVRPPTGYGDVTEENFMRGCTQSAKGEGIDTPKDYCRCVYDAIVDQIPFDRFKEINSDMSEDPQELPPVMQKIREDCVDLA